MDIFSHFLFMFCDSTGLVVTLSSI